MEAARKSTRTEELVANIREYLGYTGSETFILQDVRGDQTYATCNATLKLMRKREMIKVVGTFKNKGATLNVFGVISLELPEADYMPKAPEPVTCLGWREVSPELFMAPKLDGNLRIINGMKEF